VKVGSWAVHKGEEFNNIGVGFVWQNRQAGVVETTWLIVKTRCNDMKRQMNLTKVRGKDISSVMLGNGKRG